MQKRMTLLSNRFLKIKNKKKIIKKNEKRKKVIALMDLNNDRVRINPMNLHSKTC